MKTVWAVTAARAARFGLIDRRAGQVASLLDAFCTLVALDS